MMNGGMGDSIAQLLIRENPLPMEMVAVNDQFGQSGKPEELMEKYGLEATNIVKAAQKVISRRK
jgi:transketolase